MAYQNDQMLKMTIKNARQYVAKVSQRRQYYLGTS